MMMMSAMQRSTVVSASQWLKPSIKAIKTTVATTRFGMAPTNSNVSYRSISTLNKSMRSCDLDHVVHMVQAHDPAGYWPGRLLPTPRMQLTYYTVRSFWIETGLRFGTTAKVTPNSTPQQHLDWWQAGIDALFQRDATTTTTTATASSKDSSNMPPETALEDHPTFRLLHNLMYEEHISLSSHNFDRILQSRRNDLDVTQYATLKSIEDHAEMSCGSLAQLVLEAGGVTFPTALEATRLVGVCHGLTNALRTSIPVMSTTGKLIIPQDLCLKYGVKSPRFLLTALALGDEECRHALQQAVRDIHHSAKDHLEQARQLRDELLDKKNAPQGNTAVAVLIPGVASEVFLNRLERSNYDLTNRSLRHVGIWEHALCRARMTLAYYQQRY